MLDGQNWAQAHRSVLGQSTTDFKGTKRARPVNPQARCSCYPLIRVRSKSRRLLLPRKNCQGEQASENG